MTMLRRLPIFFLLALGIASAQMVPTRPTSPAEGNRPNPPSSLEVSDVSDLESQFFSILRSGNVKKFMSYVPKDGMNVGPSAVHLSLDQVQEQMKPGEELYCRLFDTSCIQQQIQLDNSSPDCSYRELLTHSEKVRTAATETTRNGIRQAILAARIKNQKCGGAKLIDFIFNYSNTQGWKLFSVP